MTKVRWGVVGPGNIARKFAAAIPDISEAALQAAASANADRLSAFSDAYSISDQNRYSNIPDMLDSGVIDAVYIANLHPWHAQTAVAAMRRGKHVLCEKPAGMTSAEVRLMTEVAQQENVFFAEAFMYLCHPQMDLLAQLIESGIIGKVRHIDACFGFNVSFDAESRLFAHALGGGGILDVGCYPVSFARRVAGIANGCDFAEPLSVHGAGKLGATGVDEEAHALLKFSADVTANCACAITRNMANTAKVHGELGSITLPDPWLPGQGNKPCHSRLIVNTKTGESVHEVESPLHHYAGEVRAACHAILEQGVEAALPLMNHAQSIGNAAVLDKWRAGLRYRVAQDIQSDNRVIRGAIPDTLAESYRIQKNPIAGVSSPVSELIIGCDNQTTLAEGAIIWDAWMEAGGNAFDTANIYGNGLEESVLGQWIRSRGVRDQVVVITKGAHTPYCFPHAIEPQLDISLRRLGLDSAAIYIMHRDNTEVPAGEFVEAINQLINKQRIGIYGVSNWSSQRFDEAAEYASKHGLQPPSVLNNNCALATMEKPVWPGCVSNNNAKDLDWLRRTQTVQMSWSSQARGYFLPDELRHRLPKNIGPDACFGSNDNEERRHRASTIAAEQGVTTAAVALAWVLALPHPSFAMVGPRSSGEIVSLLPALSVKLGASDVAWLNLSSDAR